MERGIEHMEHRNGKGSKGKVKAQQGDEGGAVREDQWKQSRKMS